VRDYASVARLLKRYTTAETVLTFALTLPLIAVTVAALLDHSLNEEVDKTITQTRDSAVEFQQGHNFTS
jgi:hypothetical protein